MCNHCVLIQSQGDKETAEQDEEEQPGKEEQEEPGSNGVAPSTSAQQSTAPPEADTTGNQGYDSLFCSVMDDTPPQWPMPF